MINLKHLRHIVTWGYSVALLNVTIMLHLKTMLPDCNIHLTKQTPTQAFRGAWGGGGGPGPHIYCQVPDMSNSLGLIKHIGL
jgi:hypothetical protein